MALSKEKRKEELMKAAEGLIDRMLAEERPGEEIMLEDIEQAAIRVGQGMQAEVAANMAGNVEQSTRGKCPECGKPMGYQEGGADQW
jgi:RNA polymerase-binding transcription factor DksA